MLSPCGNQSSQPPLSNSTVFYCLYLFSVRCPLSAAPWSPQFSTSVPSRHPAHGMVLPHAEELSSTPSPFWKHRHLRSCAYSHPPDFHNPVKLAGMIRHHSVGQPGWFQAQVGPALPNPVSLSSPTLNTSLPSSNNQYPAPMFCELLCIGRTVPRLAPYLNCCEVCFQAPVVLQHADASPFRSTLRSEGCTTQEMHFKVFICRLFFTRIHAYL